MATWSDSNTTYNPQWLKITAGSTPSTTYTGSITAGGTQSISIAADEHTGASSRVKTITLSGTTGDTDDTNNTVTITQSASSYNNVIEVRTGEGVTYDSSNSTYVFAYNAEGENSYFEVTFMTNNATAHNSFGGDDNITAAYYIQTTYDNPDFTTTSKNNQASTSTISWPTGFFTKVHGYVRYVFYPNGNLTGTAKSGDLRFGDKIFKYKINPISNADIKFDPTTATIAATGGTANITLKSNIATNYTLTVGDPS